MKAPQPPLWKYLLYSRPVIVLLVIALILVAKAVWQLWDKEELTERERQNLSARAAELESRLEFLNSEVARLETDRGVEEEIREKLGLAKPGEGVINIVDEPEAETEQSAAIKPKWWQALFDDISSLWED